MSRISPFITKYEEILRKDPRSKVFAALAEAYREAGQLLRAEKIAIVGIKFNPSYPSGHLALGRVLVDLKKFQDALEPLLKTTQLSPQNLLAHQLVAECYLNLSQAQMALKYFKMTLFLNPTNEKAKQAVRSLESASATQFESDIFEMKKLSPKVLQDFERSLSILDALIFRNEMTEARDLHQKLREAFPESIELMDRGDILNPKGSEPEILVPLKKLHPRSEEKVMILQKILENIQNYRAHHIDLPLITS